MGLKSHRSAEVPISRSEIDLVFVGDDFPVILQSSDGGKPMIKRFKTTPTYFEWRQPKVKLVKISMHNRCEQDSVPRAIEVFGTQYNASG